MPQKYAMTAVLALALLAPAVARAQQSPTLGELALKEQERRKALKPAGPAVKVLTNQDLPRGTAPPAGAAGQAGSTPDPKAAAKPEEPPRPEEPEKNEAWWKARISQVREELRRNEMFADALQTRINSLTNDFATRDDPYQRGRVADDRAKALVEMDRVKGDIELNRKKVAEIEDEARRAGVPPGWVR
jgi:hypothetical protein